MWTTDGTTAAEVGDGISALPVTSSVTPPESSQLSVYAAAFGATVGLLIVIFGVFGNTLMLFAIYRLPSMRKPCNVFIATLSLNDLLFLVMNCTLGVHVYTHRKWQLGSRACLYVFFMNAGAISISVSHILLITYYRYLLIVKPSCYRKLSQRRFVMAVIVLLFTLPYCLLAIVILRPGTAPSSYRYGEYIQFSERFMWCVIRTGQKESAWKVILAYLVMLFLVAMLNLKIYQQQKKSRQNARVGPQHDAVRLRRTQRNAQLARTMVVIMAIFALTYIPWPVAYELRLKKQVPEWVGVAATLLMWSASSVNWLVYGLMNRQFRRAYRRLLQRRDNAVRGTVASMFEGQSSRPPPMTVTMRMTTLNGRISTLSSNTSAQHPELSRVEMRSSSDRKGKGGGSVSGI